MHSSRTVPFVGKLTRRFRSIYRALSDAISCKRFDLDKNARRFVVQTFKNLPDVPPAESRLLVFFAHYDPQNEVDDYVQFYLKALWDLGASIIFVSGSPHLKPEAAEKIKPYCQGIFTRKTLALDFGSWHLAWTMMKSGSWDLQQFDRLLLANDSVYGPLFDLNEMFSTFHGADIYGVTESKEVIRHLQSYFLLFDLNERTRPFLQDFWGNFRYVVDRQAVVERYEIGISRGAQERGLRLQAYIPDEAVLPARLRRSRAQSERAAEGPANNTLHFWDVLISEHRCPFLKTVVPRKDYWHSPVLAELPQLIATHTPYDYRLVHDNLERLGLDAVSRARNRKSTPGDQQDAAV